MTQYCEKFGFDADERQLQLERFDLQEVGHEDMQRLQDSIIRPNVDLIVKSFYDYLLDDDDATEILEHADSVLNLMKTQKAYLLSLGKDFDSEDYFESRLHIGVLHAWVGVPITIYVAAAHKLIELILSLMKSSEESCSLQPLLIRIMMFDLMLVIEAYHQAQMDSYEHYIDHLEAQEELLERKAYTDSLTRIGNREYIISIMNHRVQQAREKKQSLSIIMLDLDHFKKVNDTYGHQTGDKVLFEVSRRVRGALRNIDSLGRYGGEEFLVVLSGSRRKLAMQIAERIRRSVSITPIHTLEHTISLTISLGVATLQSDEGADDLIKRADEALYKAKEQGRNRVIHYDRIAGRY